MITDSSRLDVKAMTDAALQEHIVRCGHELLAADTMIAGGAPDYFALMGERALWERLQREALLERGQRPAVVRALEKARGLA